MQIALLRGVNVGAARRVAMADVRRALEQAGFGGVRTLLQSGNVIFEAGAASEADLEAEIESALAQGCGLDCEAMVRTAGAWRAMIAANPFTGAAESDPSQLLAHVLKAAPAAGASDALRAAAGEERVRLIGREVLIHYPKGLANSKLVGAVLDRALGARGTGRNWNTVRRLAELADA